MLDIIPLVPTYILSLISLVCSAFVIVRIILPILPPHPFSGRVSPSQFGLPVFRSISVAHKTHLWLAACDLVALAFWLWQVGAENAFATVVAAVPIDPGASVRFAVALTLRQTCLMVIVLITLVHVRMGHSVTLGKLHWYIWLPTLFAIAGCVTFAGVLSAGGIKSLFPGLLAYISTLTVASTAIFGYLIFTLFAIHRHLTASIEVPVEPKPRGSFATEDIEALRDGSSWITSDRGSKRDSASGWSFSTWHSPLPSTAGSTRDARMASNPSLAPKSSFWFGTSGGEDIPPVPRIPSPYRQDGKATTPTFSEEFIRRPSKSSHDSWITSPSVSQASMSSFSYPSSRAATPEPSVSDHDDVEIQRLPHSSRTAVSPMQGGSEQPRLAAAKVLGGYGHVGLAEKGQSTTTISPNSKVFKISNAQIWLWFVMIWIPFVFALPGLICGILGPQVSSPVPPILLAISVAVSSPLLAFNVMLSAPIPIPSNLFPSSQRKNPHEYPHPYGAKYPGGMTSAPDSLDNLRKGMSTSTLTVVEGRRSGDVWMSKGDAVDSKTRLGRALSMLQPSPPLSLLPVHCPPETTEITPPIPLRIDDSYPSTPQSTNSAEVGKRHGALASTKSTFYSAMDGSIFHSAKVIPAAKYTSTEAKSVVLQSPERDGQPIENGFETPKNYSRPNSHLRSRSVSSSQSGHRDPLTPPPNIPLPPVPQSNGDAFKNVTVRHKRSASTGHSTGYSFTPITNAPEIDALSAGMLPLLLPGLNIGSDVNVRGYRASDRPSVPVTAALTETFSSPEGHSTPVRAQKPAPGRKKQHFSLPSLSLRKDQAFRLWRSDTTKALNATARRNSIGGPSNKGKSDSPPESLDEEEVDELGRAPQFEPRKTHRRGASSISVYSDGVESARDSLATLLNVLEMDVPRSTTPTSAITLVEDDPREAMLDQDPFTRPSSKPASKENNVPSFHLPTAHRKKSNIPYFKPTENNSNTINGARPANPKYTADKRVLGPIDENDTPTPSKLRPLSLLQDRDTNIPTTGSTKLSTFSFTSPLSVKKAGKRNSGSIKPLNLNRSETTKARGVLRRTEILPRVVVRPPSGNEHDLELVLR